MYKNHSAAMFINSSYCWTIIIFLSALDGAKEKFVLRNYRQKRSNVLIIFHKINFKIINECQLILLQINSQMFFA